MKQKLKLLKVLLRFPFNRIDQAIYEAETEVAEGAAPISLNDAKTKLDEKYYGKV